MVNTANRWKDSWVVLQKSRKIQYVTNNQLLAKLIVDDTGILSQQDGQTENLLNGLNTHGWLELYTHIVPLFGHALLLFELVFDSNHQSLRSSLSYNIGVSSHKIAMQNVIGRDWFWQLHECWSLQKIRKSSLSELSASSLRCMLYGHCRLDFSEDICSFVEKKPGLPTSI